MYEVDDPNVRGLLGVLMMTTLILVKFGGDIFQLFDDGDLL